MPARQVRDEVLTLLLAGHETTAVALTWAWHELTRDPALRSWAEAEWRAPGTPAVLDGADWEALHRTRAIIAEALRLHPPAYVLARIATEDLDLAGAHVRRGTVCFISPYALGRDPRSWGADVATFRPRRWLTADGRFDESAPGQPRGAWLPFGAGSRVCIGSAFATLEAVLVLATLGSTWRPQVTAGFDPGLHPAVTLRTRHGLPATLSRA